MMAGTGPLPRHLVDAFQVRGWCVEQKEMKRGPLHSPALYLGGVPEQPQCRRSGAASSRSQSALDRWGENTTRLERVTDLNGPMR